MGDNNFTVGNQDYMVFKKAAENWAIVHIPYEWAEDFRRDVMPLLDEKGYLYESNLPMLRLEEQSREGVFGAADGRS